MARTSRAGAACGGSILKKPPQQKTGATQPRTMKRKANADSSGENDIGRRQQFTSKICRQCKNKKQRMNRQRPAQKGRAMRDPLLTNRSFQH